MSKISSNLLDYCYIGDDYPTIIMGVINLSPESFYKGSVHKDLEDVKDTALKMISMGTQIIDIGARSTAPGTPNISIEEESNRLLPILEKLLDIIPDNFILSIDTQYKEIAEKSYSIAQQKSKKIIINDVSCLKTDPKMIDFIVDTGLPIILMASREVPGDILEIEEIIEEFEKTISLLKERGYNEEKIILDPGIGHWVPKKTYEYDLKIIGNLQKLRILNKPILVAISRKSFIGNVLDIPEPENRLNGTLSATAIAVFNGAHIVRTHDVDKRLIEFIKMAEAIRRNQ